MTQVTNNTIRDIDDTALYDAGYVDGIAKSIEIINSVRNVENVDRVPFHITMSAVVATLRATMNGEYR